MIGARGERGKTRERSDIGCDVDGRRGAECVIATDYIASITASSAASKNLPPQLARSSPPPSCAPWGCRSEFRVRRLSLGFFARALTNALLNLNVSQP